MSCVVCVEYHMSKNSVENRTKSGKSGGLLIKVCNSIFFLFLLSTNTVQMKVKKKMFSISLVSTLIR